MEVTNAKRIKKRADTLTTQHVHSLSCGGAIWPTLQVPPASLVFMNWSQLTSLPNSKGSTPQRATTGNINQQNAGVVDSCRRHKMPHLTINLSKHWSRKNCVTG